MADWFVVAELAGLPGMPGTVQGVLAQAKRKGWTSRKRSGRGGGREYHRDSLPRDTQAALQQRAALAALDRALAAVPVPAIPAPAAALAPDPLVLAEQRRRHKAEGQAKFQALAADSPRRVRAEAREWCVQVYRQLYREGRAQAVPPRKIAVRELLCEEINDGRRAIPAAYRAYLPPSYQGRRALDEATLERWITAYETDGLWGLTDGYGSRKGGTLIDTQPALQQLILGQMLHTPQITGVDLHALLTAKREELAATGVQLPALTTVQLYMRRWREDNRQLWSMMTNPGRYKNQFQVAFGSHHESVTRLNQMWEMDSTPGDWLLTDGRHTVIACLDLYSRRVSLLVSKSSKAHAVGQCFRRSALAWGLCEALRTDNGKDYVSDYLVSALHHLEVRQELCIPFKSEQKGTVERFFRTMSHGILKLLPGYIGHDVAEREAIRARETFAKRIMTPGEVVEVALSAAELQARLDEWVHAIYHQDPHAGEGMDGQTPFAKAAAWAEPIRAVDERALDALLLPLEGTRQVTKKGIRLNNRWYIAVTLGRHVGDQVYLRQDEADLGRVYVYGDDRFICVAECPELTGISRAEVTMAAQAEQRRFIAEQTQELKQFKKAQRENAAELVLRHRAKEAGKLVEFPKAAIAHQTPMLRAGAAAAAAAAPQGMREDTPAQLAAKRALAAEMDAARDQAASNVHRLSEDTPKGRYMKWLRIDNERIRGDRHHDAQTLRWWAEIYPKTQEWKTQNMLAEDHPEAYDLFAGCP